MSEEFRTPEELALYMATAKTAFRYAKRQVDRSMAKGIAFEVAEKVVRLYGHRIHEFGARGSTAAYIYTAVTNSVTSQLRKEERRAAAEESHLREERESLLDPHQEMELEELRSILLKVVDQMPNGMQAVWRHHHDGGLTYQEIALKFGIAVGTVQTQMDRASRLVEGARTRYATSGLPTEKKKRGPVPGMKRGSQRILQQKKVHKPSTDPSIGGEHTI